MSGLTSLLGTDWHIDQMKYACNESAPLPLTVGMDQYLYGTNELVFIYDVRDTVISIKDVMRVFKHPRAKVELTSGKMVDYIMSRKISVPVNKENVIKYGILDEKYAGMIPDEIVLEMPESKTFITKPELFLLDLLSNYQWDRPINMLSMGGDLDIGQKSYLMYEGFSYKLVPIKGPMSSSEPGLTDTEDLYRKMTEVFSWDALSRDDYFVDYQNLYTFCGVMSQRNLFLNAAEKMMDEGRSDRALEMLDMCERNVPEYNFPLDMTYLGFSNEYMVLRMISLYYDLGQGDKARSMAARFADELMDSAGFFLSFYDYRPDEFNTVFTYIQNLQYVYDAGGDKALADELDARITALIDPTGELSAGQES